jgi:hypothetical protein
VDSIRSLKRMAVCCIATIAAVGCGGDGSGSVDSTPAISSLQFSPTSALQYDGNGTVTVSGAFDFTDAGKDLSTLYLTSSNGSNLSFAINGAAGQPSGTIQGTLQVDTTVLGHYNFQLYVTDTAGLHSNTLSSNFDVNPNDTGSHWTPQALLPGVSPLWLKRVRWSGSMFVTVGTSIFTSPDAVTWTQQPSGLSSMMNDVTWTGSQFVVVGDNGAVLTSADAIAWTPQVTPTAVAPALNGVASSSTRLVAVGTQTDPASNTTVSLILTSKDGITWNAIPKTTQAALNAVTWSGSQFVAVGSALGQANSQAIALTSPDGVTWTSTVINQTGLNVLYDVAWNGSRFVAVGLAGAATSTDGLAWQAAGVGVVGANNAIAWSGHHFITCGVAFCELSTDGLQWQDTAQPPGTGPSVYGLAWSGTKWVAVGTNSYVTTSP